MNKFLLRLLVACTCFLFSIGLTSFSRLFRAADKIALAPLDMSFVVSVDEIQLRELYREYGPAQTRHDRAFFERVETENFALFLRDSRLSREEDIQSMETWPADVVFESEPENIKVSGNSAVVCGRMKARYGNGYISNWRFIDVWIKRDNTWRIQSTTSLD